MTRRMIIGLAALAAIALVIYADLPPTAEQILDRYVEVTGGKAAYDKLHNRVSQGTMEIAGLGITGKFTLTQGEPDRMYLEAEIPQVFAAPGQLGGVEHIRRFAHQVARQKRAFGHWPE